MIYFYEIYSIIFFRIYFPILRLFAKGICEKIVLFEIDFIKEKKCKSKGGHTLKVARNECKYGERFRSSFFFFMSQTELEL